jgi:4-oxalocrotonate tautomerase
MPLVRIDLRKGRPLQELRAIAEAVHAALVEAIGIPRQDRFQIITEHDSLVFNPSYLGIERTDELVFIQIVISAGRTVEKRTAIFALIARKLEPLVRPQDLLINLVETARENWSFGDGIAQLRAAGGAAIDEDGPPVSPARSCAVMLLGVVEDVTQGMGDLGRSLQ